MGQLEKALQNKIIEYLSHHSGTFVYECYNGGLPLRAFGNKIIWKRKNERNRPNGFPDLILFCRGETILIEVKTSDGRLSAYQKKTNERLAQCGIQVVVIRSLNDARTLMAYLSDPSSDLKNLTNLGPFLAAKKESK